MLYFHTYIRPQSQARVDGGSHVLRLQPIIGFGQFTTIRKRNSYMCADTTIITAFSLSYKWKLVRGAVFIFGWVVREAVLLIVQGKDTYNTKNIHQPPILLNGQEFRQKEFSLAESLDASRLTCQDCNLDILNFTGRQILDTIKETR